MNKEKYRETVFISHATPEDNDFAIWLSSRLQSMGYSTWVDKKALIGGEKFWQEIDQIIRNKAAKFLLVYSDSICFKNEPGKLKDGIYKEYSLAESIAKQENISDFIILLRIDHSNYNLFIGADRLNQIQFTDDWSFGLSLLIEKLNKDDIPINESQDSSQLINWFEKTYTDAAAIKLKSELYYSNLWKIQDLPDKFYLFQFEKEQEAKKVYEKNSDRRISKISNILASFDEDIPLKYIDNSIEYEIKPLKKVCCETAAAIDEPTNISAVFPTKRDISNHLKALLTRILHLYLKDRKMFWYELANKRQAYFHTFASLPNRKVKFKYPFKKKGVFKQKNIIGRYKELGYWHYAVSFKPIFKPIIGFSMKSHIIFTKNGFDAWKDKNAMHTHRRAKGKRLFNAEWRDMELAFINSLIDDDGNICLKVNNSIQINLPRMPEVFWADFGYFEPQSDERLSILVENDEEIEADDE
ncbi:MAG: toll/interleukin-1 receptor domain-containing protein [bacterium]